MRLAENFTARRNVLPPAQPNGRPAEYGSLVRPLARKRKDKSIPATAPDRTESWTAAGLTFRAEFWDNLPKVPDVKVSATTPTFFV